MGSRWPTIIYRDIVKFYLIVVAASVTTIYASIILFYIYKYVGLIDIGNKVIEHKQSKATSYESRDNLKYRRSPISQYLCDC
jgi:hypothetical protein